VREQESAGSSNNPGLLPKHYQDTSATLLFFIQISLHQPRTQWKVLGLLLGHLAVATKRQLHQPVQCQPAAISKRLVGAGPVQVAGSGT